MIVERKLFSEVAKYSDDRQVIVITGMRRVGKTTLLNFFFSKVPTPNKLFLDLEDPLNRAIFDKRSYEVIKQELVIRGVDFSQKAFIFLDEIQYLANIPSVVKYFYDHYDVKFFLTGSASFYLKNLFSESLAGRKVVFELFPLDFEEFLQFKNVPYKIPSFAECVSEETYELFSPLLKEYCLWGGMPEVVLAQSPEKKVAALRDIFSSYFQKEVLVLGDFGKNTAVRDLILLLSRRIGQKVDLKRLSQEMGISRQTLYEYLEFLSGTYFISLLSALGKADVAVRKQRKVYFSDTGFFSILDKPPFGSQFENLVFLNLRTEGSIYYWQEDGAEVDFIVRDAKGRKSAFEVKETAVSSDAAKLSRFANRLGIKDYYLLSYNFSPVRGVKYIFQFIPKKDYPETG